MFFFVKILHKHIQIKRFFKMWLIAIIISNALLTFAQTKCFLSVLPNNIHFFHSVTYYHFEFADKSLNYIFGLMALILSAPASLTLYQVIMFELNYTNGTLVSKVSCNLATLSQKRVFDMSLKWVIEFPPFLTSMHFITTKPTNLISIGKCSSGVYKDIASQFRRDQLSYFLLPCL